MTKPMDFRFKDSVSPKDGRIGITRKYTSGYTIYNEWDTNNLTEEEYNEFSKVVGKFFLKRDEDKVIQFKEKNIKITILTEEEFNNRESEDGVYLRFIYGDITDSELMDIAKVHTRTVEDSIEILKRLKGIDFKVLKVETDIEKCYWFRTEQVTSM